MLKRDKVRVAFLSKERTGWTFGNARAQGTIFHYKVSDYNYRTRNQWRFAIQVPNEWTKGNYIVVKPESVPNRRAWAGLERRSLSFHRATLGQHRGRLYGMLAISDVQGAKTKIQLTRSNTKLLMPKWLREFSPLEKGLVTTTRGKVGEHVVAVLDRGDHGRMIRLFLALKAWILDDARSSSVSQPGLRSRVLKHDAKRLRGRTVVVTGHLDYGTRDQVWGWLQRHGARVRDTVTSKTDLVIVGAHPLGEDRLKIKHAQENGVSKLTEARFRHDYAV